jgi:hypothetical protein
MRFVRFAAASAAMTLAVGGFTASTSFAMGHPKFNPLPTYSIIDDAVYATGSITGAGNQDAVVSISAVAEVGCANKPGKLPKGHRQTVSGAPATFPHDENGRINFTVHTGAIQADCPGKMTPVVIQWISATVTATLGNVKLTDTHTF